MNDVTIRFLDFYNYLVNEKKIKDKSDFAKKIGVSSSSLTEIWKKRSNVGLKIIQNTVKFFTEINSHWLLTGEGDMLKTEGPVFEKKADCEQYKEIIREQKDLISSLKENNKQLLRMMELQTNLERSRKKRQD